MPLLRNLRSCPALPCFAAECLSRLCRCFATWVPVPHCLASQLGGCHVSAWDVSPRCLAVIPPIVVQDELASGALVELARLDDISEVFCAVTIRRRFPNPLLAEVLGPGSRVEGRS